MWRALQPLNFLIRILWGLQGDSPEANQIDTTTYSAEGLPRTPAWRTFLSRLGRLLGSGNISITGLLAFQTPSTRPVPGGAASSRARDSLSVAVLVRCLSPTSNQLQGSRSMSPSASTSCSGRTQSPPCTSHASQTRILQARRAWLQVRDTWSDHPNLADSLTPVDVATTVPTKYRAHRFSPSMSVESIEQLCFQPVLCIEI